MLGLIRLFAMFLVLLTVVYWSLLLYLRAGERERLEERWEAERPPLPRHTYVDNGLRAWRGPLRRRLFVGVYVVPIAVVCGLIYVFNYA